MEASIVLELPNILIVSSLLFNKLFKFDFVTFSFLINSSSYRVRDILTKEESLRPRFLTHVYGEVEV